MTSVPQIADLVAEAVAVDRTEPLVLFGYSGASLWALETAQQLSPALLATAACQAPVIGRIFEYPDMTDEESRAFTRRQLLALGITDAQILTELVDLSVPILAADMALSRGWRPPDQPLSCPVVSYFGSEDAVPADSWSAFTVAAATTVHVPGDHYFMRYSAGAVISDLAQRMCGMPMTAGSQ